MQRSSMRCPDTATAYTLHGKELGCKEVMLVQDSAMAAAANHAGADAASSHTQASLARGGIMKLADWNLEAVVRSGTALQEQGRQPRRGHRQGHLALGTCPGQ